MDRTAETATAEKSANELRAERMTWFGLVGILVVSSIMPDGIAMPNALIPLAAGLVLILSGVYQRRQKWRVHFSTWAAGALMLAMAIYNVFERPELDLSFVVIILTVIVIAIGAFTNET